jgi:4-azaleucine resistance transporter AzlC
MADRTRDRGRTGDGAEPAATGRAFPPASVVAGFKATTPVALGVGAYGIALGLVAATDAGGISLAELLLMDVLVLAGSAQIVAVGLWDQPVPVVSIVVATLVVNLRYILICATLHPLFAGRPLWVKLAGIHSVADENWAITMAEHRRRPQVPGFLLGGGIAIQAFWFFGCLVGFLVGGSLPPPEQLGLDFAFTAAFIALALGFWRGKGDLWPWVAAGGSAVVTHALVGGTWHILVGGLCGAVVAALVPGPEPALSTATAADGAEVADGGGAPAGRPVVEE